MNTNPIAVPASKQVIFFDNFETFTGWTQYLSGQVNQTTINPYSGSYCAIKTTGADNPSGAYKLFNTTTGPQWELHIWLQKYSAVGGGAERLFLCNSSGNGYGFSQDGANTTIDRITAYALTSIASVVDTRTSNVWYKIVLSCTSTGLLTCKRYNASGNLLSTCSITDTTYNTFDRFHIAGGREFLIDNIVLYKKLT